MPAVGYGVRIIGGHFARLWNVVRNKNLEADIIVGAKGKENA
jgi:hypothetical protein